MVEENKLSNSFKHKIKSKNPFKNRKKKEREQSDDEDDQNYGEVRVKFTEITKPLFYPNGDKVKK